MKKQIEGFVKNQLRNNDTWAIHACVRLFEFQTYDEQQSETTQHDNGVGFNALDSEILSSFAKQIIAWNMNRAMGKQGYSSPLSQKQKDLLKRKIGKYWKQIINISDMEKLEKQSQKWAQKLVEN